MNIRVAAVFCLFAISPVLASSNDFDPIPGSPGIQQNGQSSIDAFRTKGGCLKTHTENVRFEPVKLWLRRGEDQDLILRETIEQDRFDCLDGAGGKVSVEATSFDHDLKKTTKLWSFTSKGFEGTPSPHGYNNLYEVSFPGCCDSSETLTYFSLVNGMLLFRSTVPILDLRVPNSDIQRYVGLLDNLAADDSGIDTKNGDVVAILSYGSDRDAPQRLLIHANKGDSYHARDMMLLMDGKKTTDKTIDLWKFDSTKSPVAITGIAIRGEMICECDRDAMDFEVPIVDGKIRADLAKSSDPTIKFSTE